MHVYNDDVNTGIWLCCSYLKHVILDAVLRDGQLKVALSDEHVLFLFNAYPYVRVARSLAIRSVESSRWSRLAELRRHSHPLQLERCRSLYSCHLPLSFDCVICLFFYFSFCISFLLLFRIIDFILFDWVMIFGFFKLLFRYYMSVESVRDDQLIIKLTKSIIWCMCVSGYLLYGACQSKCFFRYPENRSALLLPKVRGSYITCSRSAAISGTNLWSNLSNCIIRDVLIRRNKKEISRRSGW